MSKTKEKQIRRSNLQYPTFQEICWEQFQVWFDAEFHAIPNRRFTADFALPCCNLIIEIQGGAFSRGKGHTSITNYLNDIEKLNLYAINKYSVLWFTPQMVENLEHLTTLREFFYNNKCSHLAENISRRMLARID